MDRSRLERLETGIQRDPKTKELLASTKVKMDGGFQKIRRVFPDHKENLVAARIWMSKVKDQYRRRHHTMRLRTNGTWVVNLPMTEKYAAKTEDFGYNFSSALEWAKNAYDERARGKWNEERKTVEQAWNCYQSHNAQLPKATTLGEYKRIWGRELKAYWANVLLDDVSAKSVQSWINDWSGTNAALKHAKGVLSVILSHAVEEDWMTHNPAYRRKLPKSPKPKAEGIPPEKLIVAINHPKRASDRLAMAVSFETGLRWSEWAPLRVKDFNPTTRKLEAKFHVTRDEKARPVIEIGSKTDVDSKSVALSEPLAKLLLDFITEEKRNPEDLLFPSPNGQMWAYNNWRNRVWEPAREAAAIDRVKYMTGTHTARRSAITIAYEGGVNVNTIRSQTKHSDTHIITKTYLQSYSDAEYEVADTIHSKLGLPRIED